MLKDHIVKTCFSLLLFAFGLSSSFAQAYLKELLVFEDCLVGGGTAFGIAILSEPAEDNKAVTLVSSDVRITVPATVEIPQGESEGYFEASVSFHTSAYSGSVYGSLDNWMQKAKVAQVPDSGALAISTFTATQGNGGVWLSWNGQEEDIFGLSVAGYFVQRKTNKGDFEDLTWVPSTSASYVDNLAEDGNTYTYRIQLRDSSGGVLATSLERAVSYSGGAPTITWIDPPVEPVSGVITLRANNPDPTQESFTVYVDGEAALSGFTPSSSTGGSDVIKVEFDSTSFSNGVHVIWLASDSADSNLFTSTPIFLDCQNMVSSAQSDSASETSSRIFPEFRCQFASGTTSFTITIENSIGQTVRTWVGGGDFARVTWDGKNDAGTALPAWRYTLRARSGRSGLPLDVILYNSVQPPRFLAIIHYTEDFFPQSTLAYADYVQNALARLESDTGVSYAVLRLGEGEHLSRRFVSLLRKWLKFNVDSFYVMGHGRRLAEGDT